MLRSVDKIMNLECNDFKSKRDTNTFKRISNKRKRKEFDKLIKEQLMEMEENAE